MKTEENIKAHMKSYLMHSFNDPSRAEKLQAKAEALQWVLEMTTDDFYNFWDEAQEEYERRIKHE